MKRQDTAGFDLVNWNDRVDVEMVSLAFADDLLRKLPSFGVVPDGYDGFGYDSTYGDLKLFVENIGPGYYHVSIRDYSCGWTRDLGAGTYDYDYDEHPGWSDLERILANLSYRITSGEIDLDRALSSYYTVGDDALRRRSGTGDVAEAVWQNREGVRAGLAKLENKDFARACVSLMRDGGMPAEDFERLADPDFCEREFGSAFPVLRRTFAACGNLPKGEVMVDGAQRYYYDVHEIRGKRYLVTNDWYGFRPGARRNNRSPFVEWLLSRIEL